MKKIQLLFKYGECAQTSAFSHSPHTSLSAKFKPKFNSPHSHLPKLAKKSQTNVTVFFAYQIKKYYQYMRKVFYKNFKNLTKISLNVHVIELY